MIRVMICEDMKEISENLKTVIERQENMTVVGIADTTESSIRLAKELKPDVLLLDIQMDEADSGIKIAASVSEALPDTRMIVLTIHNNDDTIAEAYQNGAVDYLLKDATEEEICSSIRKVYQNEDFIGKMISQVLKKKMAESTRQKKSLIFMINHLSKLTPTEMMILQMLYQKKNRKTIAKENFMAEDTVKVHIRHILKKLDFSTTMEMINFLKKLGVMELFQLKEEEE